MSQVTGIFTGTTISPGPSLRQRPNRYAFRAGRNLPDKEFRYLRTVIVTAAVYWGLDSELSPLLLTFQHRAGVSPYTSSFDLAETCVFDKQSLGPFHCNPFGLTRQQVPINPNRVPLLPKLRGHFAEFLNEGYSRAPEDTLLAYLCRFAVRAPINLARGFSWQYGIGKFATLYVRSPSRLRIISLPDLPERPPYTLRRTQPTVRFTYPPASPHHS